MCCCTSVPPNSQMNSLAFVWCCHIVIASGKINLQSLLKSNLCLQQSQKCSSSLPATSFWWQLLPASTKNWRSVAKSCVTLWLHGLQHTMSPCPPPSSRVCSDSRPLSQWCHPTISSFVTPFSSCPLNLSQHSGLFQWVSSSDQMAKVLALQLQSFWWIFTVDFL